MQTIDRMTNFILDNIQWLVTSVFAMIVWAVKMEYNTRENRKMMNNMRDELKQLREQHKLLKELAKNVEGIKTDQEWIKKAIQRLRD